MLEFSIISGLIFEPSLVQPGVLLGQIVVFLPFFAITWGWIFCQLDWVGADQPGRVVVLNDAGQMTSYSRFDHFHSTIHTLINKGTPAISGVRETLENPAYLRENEIVIAGQDWVNGW